MPLSSLMFAGSITEAVWPLGCSVRRNVSPLASSTSWLVATETERRLLRRKSTPRIGKVTSAFRNVHQNVRPLNWSRRRSSPQQRIGWPLGPMSLGRCAGGVVGLVGEQAKCCSSVHKVRPVQ